MTVSRIYILESLPELGRSGESVRVLGLRGRGTHLIYIWI